MLNHTYTSVKNANLVDCGKKQHITSQPTTLLKDNFLGEFRTELDKKKVLANLGIATSLSLEWEYIKGDIGRSSALMSELDSRTKYISSIDGYQKTLADGLKYLESVIGGEMDDEAEQNRRLSALESTVGLATSELESLKTYLSTSIEVDIQTLQTSLATITEKVNNITNLIQVSTKENNALVLEEGETPGLYVPDLSPQVTKISEDITSINSDIDSIQTSLTTFVTKDELGGGDFNFVNQTVFDAYTKSTTDELSSINEELKNTVKTGEDGHVDTLFVNTISKDNEGSIKLTDSFEVTSGIPLDIRAVVENLEELHNLDVRVCYPGMGVIVNSLSALYILRKPEEGVAFSQEYVSNDYNWKCPEDLVTVALSRTDYDSLEEVNPNVFYYIYEDEIPRTSEPKREEYSTEEEFNAAWQEWVDSLKVLSQEYMSASWGVDIENKLGKKASAESVGILSQEIAKIKGSVDGPSIDSLSKSIETLEAEDSVIHERINVILDSEGASGRIVTLESDLADVKKSLDDYVTKEDLQDSENDFIFVNKDTYAEDWTTYKTEVATKLETQLVSTTSIQTDSVILGENTLVDSEQGLQYNDQTIALAKDVPNVQVMSKSEYESLGESVDETTYYYTYDDDESLATKTDLATAVAGVSSTVETLGSTLSKYVLKTDFDALALKVKELEDFIATLKEPNT